MSTEEITWACECGDTIKFSGLPDSFTRSLVLSLISRHELLGHEPVSCEQASQIRQTEAKRGRPRKPLTPEQRDHHNKYARDYRARKRAG